MDSEIDGVEPPNPASFCAFPTRPTGDYQLIYENFHPPQANINEGTS